MLNPNIKLPPCTTKQIHIKKEHFKKSKSTDALLSPIALAIRPLIKKDCDVLATGRQVLYYSRFFDRKNIDVILGEGREGIINIPDNIIKIIKTYEEEGVIEEIQFPFPIPKILLDK